MFPHTGLMITQGKPESIITSLAGGWLGYQEMYLRQRQFWVGALLDSWLLALFTSIVFKGHSYISPPASASGAGVRVVSRHTGRGSCILFSPSLSPAFPSLFALGVKTRALHMLDQANRASLPSPFLLCPSPHPFFLKLSFLQLLQGFVF